MPRVTCQLKCEEPPASDLLSNPPYKIKNSGYDNYARDAALQLKSISPTARELCMTPILQAEPAQKLPPVLVFAERPQLCSTLLCVIPNMHCPCCAGANSAQHPAAATARTYELTSL
jgi:hypothetical protein